MGKNITAVAEEYDKILNERIDKGVESLRKYKETRAEALKITTPKLGSWPSDPTIKTIGDLFGYVFHNPEGGEKWEPSVMQAGHTAVGDYFSDINGKNSDDKTIFDKYKVLSDTYRKPPKYLDAIKKKGGGQYWFDFIMYFMYKLMKKQGPWKKAAVGPSWPGEKTKSPEKKVSDLATLKDFEDYVYYESEFLDSANQESFTTYKGLLDLIEPLDLLYDELLYQAVLEAGDEYIGKYTAEIDKIYTEKGDSLLITYLDIVPDPKPVSEISTTSTVVSTRSVKMIDSDFTFNVEKENIFSCSDTAIGELTIIKKEGEESLTTDPVLSPENEEQLLDPEYTESTYSSEEEQEIIFETSKYEPEPMSGNSYEETTVVDLVTGDDADFWSLIAICACEDGDPQGRADVAQSIYNRVLAGIYGGKSIKKVVCNNGQYEPAFNKIKRSVTSDTWKVICNKKTAVSAVSYAKGIDEKKALIALQLTYTALSDTKYQAAAREWVGPRCDFLGAGLGKRWFKKTAGEWQPFASSTEPRRRNESDNIFGNVVGPGAWKWGLSGKIASVPTFFAKYRNDMFGLTA